MRAIKIFNTFSLSLVLLCTAAVSGPVYAQTTTKKIVFISGKKDHGRPGRHEYEADVKALAWCLENASNLKGIKTEVFTERAPQDLSKLEGASLIVINSSSDRDPREQHALFPQDATVNHGNYDQATRAYLKGFDAILKKGAGFAAFHYGLWVENYTARDYYLDWLGGIWVQSASKNPSGEWEVQLKNPDHPILRGVKPWSFEEEIFYNPMLIGEERRTDLLIGIPKKVNWWGAKPDGPEVAAWAYTREDGSRGFAYGGLDFHKNMMDPNVRKFVLNGLVWAAGMEVPQGGVESTLTPEKMAEIEATCAPPPPRPRRFGPGGPGRPGGPGGPAPGPGGPGGPTPGPAAQPPVPRPAN